MVAWRLQTIGASRSILLTIAAQDDAMVFCEFERVIDAADGQDAHGASRPMHEGDVFGHQIVHAITENGVGVPAAEFHDVVAAGGVRLAPNCGCRPFGQLTVAELVDIFHGRLSAASPSSSLSTPASRIMASVRSASSGETLCSA